MTTASSWEKAFRDGFAPGLSTAALTALADGLRSDDLRLLQGATTSPPPMSCVQDWPVEAADAIGYAGWQGDGLETVGEVEQFFARACAEADERLNFPKGSRYFINFFDDTPRHEMRRLLLAVVEDVLASRPQLELAEVA